MVDFNKIKKNLGEFGKKASETAVIATANGAYGFGKKVCTVGKETINLAKAVHEKNTAQQKESAEKIVDEIVIKTARGISSLAKQTGKVAVDAKDYVLEKNPELKDKKLHNTIVGFAVVGGTIAGAALIGDAISSVEAAPLDLSDIIPIETFLPAGDVNFLVGIDNSIVGPNADLQALSELGMRSELVDNHIDSSLIERSESAKFDFLHSIGYDHIPKGYEIHHVVPISQGGLDIPENMVLISETDHDFITAQHRQFYNW